MNEVIAVSTARRRRTDGFTRRLIDDHHQPISIALHDPRRQRQQSGGTKRS